MKQLFKFGLKDGKLYSVVGLPFADARSIGLEGVTGRLLLGGNTRDVYIAKHKLSKPEDPVTWRLLSKSLTPHHSETMAVFNDNAFYEQRFGRGIFKHTISFPDVGQGNLIYASDDSMGVSVGYGTIWAVDNISDEIVGIDGTALGQTTTCSSTYLSSIATDFYSVYPNNKDVYRIYATDYLGRRLHRATLNIATNTLYDYVYYENIFDVDNPYGVGIDGHNNVWCFGQGTSTITKIYRLEDGTTFPIGGNCRYPTCRLNDYVVSQNSAFNDRIIEWFLLRAPELMEEYAQRAYYALLVDHVESESAINPSCTRYYAGKTVIGFTREEKIQNVEDWNRTFGSDLDNCQGRRVFPNYDGASVSNVGDKYTTVTPLTLMSPPKALSDFTGKVAIDSTTLITEMMRTDNPEDVYESESSSSSVMNNTYYPNRYRTYVSNCKSLSAINNPMAGTEAGMIYLGYFDVSYNASTESVHEPKHIEIGGLCRNVVNNGMIYCNNAGKLFSMGVGGISLTLNLPHAIHNGIYNELADGNGGLIKDKLIWAVNMGDAYITQPGLYAAFTPSGLEFTSWSHLSKTTVLDTSINISENADFTLDFVWNKNGLLDDVPDVNVAIFLNGELKSWSSGLIGDDALENLYSRKDSTPQQKDGTPKHADFCLMGNQSRLLTLDGVIRRIETYTARPSSSSETSSDGSLSSSSQSQDRIGRASASLPMSFTGTREHVAIIKDVKFGTVVSQTTDLRLTKESGSFLHRYGEDRGQSIEANVVFPNAGIDLPPGFDLVFKL